MTSPRALHLGFWGSQGPTGSRLVCLASCLTSYLPTSRSHPSHRHTLSFCLQDSHSGALLMAGSPTQPEGPAPSGEEHSKAPLAHNST